MGKIMRSFRSKMVLLFGLSMLLSGLVTYLIFKGLQYYYHTMVQYEDPMAQFRIFLGRFGDFNLFFILFILLSFLFFFFLTKPYSAYFNEISSGIRYLARGDFQHKVHIQSNDEFRDIALDINLASEKLQEAIKRGDFSESSKDQLVVNLAHDLRTPLTSVLGYLDLILKDESLTKEQVRHFLTIAFTKSQRLERLIDELFEITRMNYGMLPLEKKRINLTDLLNQLKEELYPVFEKNHLIARMNSEPHLPIFGDGDLIARVFENLMTNAIRYGYEGQYVDINGYIEAEEVVVQIVNYGDSIPSNELPYLFDMFYTGDKARTHQEDSTGLGLFIAKNIVEQHDGSIAAESSVIQTVFEVRLPKDNELDTKELVTSIT
ncbi:MULTISPECIES: cell wall metabolism sensor histidine kinase WalK [Cytobacillus]|jgi:two-component system, OmpR family, sensor histidine kinase VanS|uniref:sensor histidine kinase n=1 Tax=Cytobacillus TaxID=2675230 RepID=UPI001863F7F7|nr:HAMP domain-containing sensor histidine kinase [Cytobacillus oceanisediminis]MBY0156636.1 HAMP domain-containing histidine kinase [Cytobacillus firmus]MBU8730224.1 HAMP domain-containing histidine kinase [Cytobacillus oceanisediminis]MCM3242049.1 HAMP domain-containing histidine kinase [Cytobacillus oceanisediminis]MCM3391133.1 HAMP domain-containing histidine kinase [Cytobacillus oceanisediminis]MCM3403291.1 HAMP domain-containing histidine kinase [Cytobacillus oceanisediminis]